MHRENNRQAEIKELTSKGIIPFEHEVSKKPELFMKGRTFLSGRVAAVINDILPAKVIVDSMVEEAVQQLQIGASLIAGAKSKL